MLPVDYVTLEYSAQQGQAALREISGHEEWMVNGTHTLVTIHLLDRLLVELPGTACEPGSASELTAADRDRLLAAIYQRNYGRQIVSSVICSACGQAFDLDFNLPELLETLSPAQNPMVVERHQGGYKLPDGSQFRLPTGEDELAIAQLTPEQAVEELMRRCVSGFENQVPQAIQAAMQAAMQEAAPLVDLDLDVSCAACGQNQTVHFNLQHYLLAAIHAEQPRLAREVHLLATAYGWGMEAILSLTRSQRRTYVALIEGQPARMGRRRLA